MTAALFGHLAFILVAVSLAVQDIFWLRVISILASASSLYYNYVFPLGPQWLTINWNIVFITINFVSVVFLIHARISVRFTEEEKELFATQFKNFSAVEFMKLLRAGKWRHLAKDEVVSRQGEKVTDLSLIYNGRVRVLVDEREIAVLKDGHFIGEMSFTSRGLATATCLVAEPTQCLTWHQESLWGLMRRNPSMRTAMQSVINIDIVNKLKSTL